MVSCMYACMHASVCEPTLHAQGMSIDDSELREYTHGLFGSMAGILKQDFQPFLATCVAAALASCQQVSQRHPPSLLSAPPYCCAAFGIVEPLCNNATLPLGWVPMVAPLVVPLVMAMVAPLVVPLFVPMTNQAHGTLASMTVVQHTACMP